ncbi:hypothetical protein [Hydrogenovibrio sp. SC-1]|nr:hypothetical protein [Hydrogenovibrio sp. SC-1]
MTKETQVKINKPSQTQSRFAALMLAGIAFVATSYAINDKLFFVGTIA